MISPKDVLGALGDGASWVRQAASATLHAVTDTLDRTLNEDTVRLAVTGLSRSGKTVFITSLIQNLLALSATSNTLPALTERLQTESGSRLAGVRVLPALASTLPRFDFEGKRAVLSLQRPDWPPPTDDVAEIALVLTLERRNQVGRTVLGQRRVRLEILDYPGEWLLDLPLLRQDYAAWSRQTLALLREEPRLGCARDFLDYVDSHIRPDDRAQDDLIRRAHVLYRQALENCRTRHGLRFLQPGRFLSPGPQGTELPVLWFFPLAVGDGAPRPGSTAELLATRFAAYKDFVSTSFFDPYFNRFNRQVMLVDVLSALYAGRAAFEDTARAVADIVGGLSTQDISRVAMVATKADHVPELSRANMTELLGALTRPALAGKTGAPVVTFRSAASVNSTQEGKSRLGDREVPVVNGVVDGKLRPFFVGQVPSIWPPDSYWDGQFFALPTFQPRPADPGTGRIPHLGLDLVLNDVIGDLL